MTFHCFPRAPIYREGIGKGDLRGECPQVIHVFDRGPFCQKITRPSRRASKASKLLDVALRRPIAAVILSIILHGFALRCSQACTSQIAWSKRPRLSTSRDCFRFGAPIYNHSTTRLRWVAFTNRQAAGCLCKGTNAPRTAAYVILPRLDSATMRGSKERLWGGENVAVSTCSTKAPAQAKRAQGLHRQ